MEIKLSREPRMGTYDIHKWASTLYATEAPDLLWKSLPVWCNYVNCSLFFGQFFNCPLQSKIKNLNENTFAAEKNPFQ